MRREKTREEWKASIVAAFRDGRDPNAWPITKLEFAELIVLGIEARGTSGHRAALEAAKRPGRKAAL